MFGLLVFCTNISWCRFLLLLRIKTPRSKTKAMISTMPATIPMTATGVKPSLAERGSVAARMARLDDIWQPIMRVVGDVTKALLAYNM
jgi:hypothetical protein